MRIRHLAFQVDQTCLIGFSCRISSDFVAGAYSYIGPGAEISAGVRVGNYTMFGPGVKVIGNDHVFDKAGIPIVFSGRPKLLSTAIGSDVWLGANVIVKTGVTIGDGVIVGANSVVTKSLHPYGIYAGVPAKFIRHRFSKASDIELHKSMLSSAVFRGDYAARSW